MRIKNQNKYLIFTLLFILTACGGSKEVFNIGDYSEESVDVQNRENIKVKSTFHDALKEKTLGNEEEAQNLFEKVLELDPGNDAAMYELARLHLDNNNYLEAGNYIQQALKIQPENKWYNLLFADILVYDGEYDEAAGIYEKLLSNNPDPELYFKLAYLYERSRNYPKAISTYDKLETLIGVEESVIEQKQKLYLKLNQFENAASEIRKLIERDPDNARYYGLLAEVYEGSGNTGKAINAYLELIEKDPENPFAAFSLAHLYEKEGDDKNRLKYIRLAFKDPSFSIDLKMGYLLEYFDRLHKPEYRDEAFELARMVIEAHPENAKAYAIYGDLLNNAGSKQQALEQYIKALDLDQNIFSVWEQTLFLQSSLGRYKDLKEYSQRAIEYFPNQATPYFFNGFAKSNLEEYEQAIRMLDRALLIGASDQSLQVEIHSTMGDVYHSLGKYQKSDESYDKSLEINPDNAFVLNNYSYYLSLRKENLEKAAEMARKANVLSPDNSAFQDTYGWVLYQQGKFKDAKMWLEKALENGGDERPVILEHYGDVLFRLDQIDQAVKYWEKAVEKGGNEDQLKQKITERRLIK